MLKSEVSSNDFTRYFEEAVSWLTKYGYDQIKADCDGYDAPGGFKNANSEQMLVPDLTAFREQSKSYFEISLKTESKSELATKWKLLESMAKLRNGLFKIFAPRGHVRFTREMVEKYSIEAEIIPI